MTFARIAKFPEPGWQVPRSASFSPDGKRLTYLLSDNGGEEMALWSFDLATQKSTVILRASDLTAASAPATKSLAQELRDERQRKRIKGITEYQWAANADTLIVPSGADVFAVQGLSGSSPPTITELTKADGEVLDPQLCADGTKVAFVRGSELAVLDVATQRETALTSGAPSGVTRGLSDFNGQEEFDEPSGLFWSPNCTSLAYLEVDERGVAEEPVMGHRGGETRLMMQKYPRTGAANPSVTVSIVDVKSKRRRAVPLPASVPVGGYFGRFQFTSDSKTLVFWALDRAQRTLTLVATDLSGATPKSRVVYTRHVERGWLELQDLVVAEDDQAVWTLIEDKGHDHLARVPLSGEAPTLYTHGEWDVIGIAGLAAGTSRPQILATRDDPIGRMLYEVSGPDALTLLTPDRGYHDVVTSSEGDAFFDIVSSTATAPRAILHTRTSKLEIQLPTDADISALALRTPEALEIPLPDGGPKLFGALLPPRKLEPGKTYPLIVMVYGGPGVQTVLNRWAPRLLWQHLADRGFFVMQVDNRGSSGRGPAFAQAIDRRLGEIELADQLAALDHVLAKHPIDRQRVGIYGHSYGGFMAALAMLKAPGRFSTAVAGSPVTDWRLYDTGYTERYMGTPAQNVAGYDASDLEKFAGGLSGNLLLLHALMDENVHFQNTADLVDALVRAGKPFDYFVFPGERHGYRSSEARSYANAMVARYFAQKLAPPATKPE